VAQLPEGQLYSHLYVSKGAPTSDSKRLRRRIGHFFNLALRKPLREQAGHAIEIEIGWADFSFYQESEFTEFFSKAALVDFLNSITVLWQNAVQYDREAGYTHLANDWREFVERAFREENVSYRIDDKGGVHPVVDYEFERNKVSAIASLADPRYAAVEHAFRAAFDSLNSVPIDGKTAARNVFEAAESLCKIVTGSSADLTESSVEKHLRPIVNRIAAGDDQLSSMTGRLLSSFAKWVSAVHAYRHGHDRDRPLVLPDDVAVLVVSEGAAFVRWLVDVDRRAQAMD